MTELEVFAELCACLDIVFPDDGGGPSWNQEQYRSDFFKVFAKSYDSCPLHGERIERHLEARWVPRKNDLSKKDRRSISEICQAWEEWRYAWDKFPR
jgi:hypothetical protein